MGHFVLPKRSVFLAIGAALTLTVCACVFIYFAGHHTKRDVVPRISTSPGSGGEKSDIATVETLANEATIAAKNIPSVNTEQREKLVEESARALEAYRAQDFGAIIRYNMGAGKKAMPFWDDPRYATMMTEQLSWWFRSIALAGPIEFMAADPSSPDMPRKLIENVAVSRREQGDSPMTSQEHLAAKSVEMRVPIYYLDNKDESVNATLGLEFSWSDREKKWYLMKLRFWGVPVGKTIPMLPV